jgi:hypothetical protein
MCKPYKDERVKGQAGENPRNVQRKLQEGIPEEWFDDLGAHENDD